MTTMFVPRALTKTLAGSKRSVLLLGPRQTGKSTLIESLQPELSVNLADEETYLAFASNPRELPERLKAGSFRTVFIDEVQRLPTLLNTLQTVLDDRQNKTRFYLTGSSARKLKRGKANLLPGRIHIFELGPLTFPELGNDFELQRALETGLLPGIYTEEEPQERIRTLRSYSATYLKEEIQAEALTRNLEGFSRFLFVVAHWSGRFVDLSKAASEAQISRQSVARFFDILEDTLIARRCPSFSGSLRKRLVQHPKFYLFDTGVLNAMLNNFSASSDRAGLLFEHLFFSQLVTLAALHEKALQVSSYRTEHGAEVDFIVELDGKVWAIELKASRNAGYVDLRGFKSFGEFYDKPHQPLVAYWGDVARKTGRVLLMPWQRVFREMGLR